MTFRREDLAEGVTLYCADMREVLDQIISVDSIVTDPPYGISLVPQRGLTEAIQGDGRNESRELWTFLSERIASLVRPDTGHLFWTGWSEVWTKEVLEMNLTVKSCIVWKKNTWGIGYYTRPQHEFAWYCHFGKPPLHPDPVSDLWEVPKIQSPIHSCEKPVTLMKAAIRLCEPVGNGLIFDPFMGVGSTGVASVELGRRFIGIEIDPDHFDVARKRIGAALNRGPQAELFPSSKSALRQETLAI